MEPPGPLSLVVVDDSEVFSEDCAGAAGAASAPGAPGAPGAPCAPATGTVVVVSFSHPTTAVPNRNAILINAAALPICPLIIILPSSDCSVL